MTGRTALRQGKLLHPLPVRIMHWVNAVAMLIMIGSGWRIYQDEVLFGWLSFPEWITLGGDIGRGLELRGNGAFGALQWHFLGMWLLVLNGAAYLAYGVATGRFRRMLLPVWPREVLREVRKALRFDLQHSDLTVYNAVQRLLYIGVIGAGILSVLTGLAIWKPVQLWWIAGLFGDFQTARLVHFVAMAGIVGFLVVHVALALLVPRTLVAMVTGGPRLAPSPARTAQPALPQPGEQT